MANTHSANFVAASLQRLDHASILGTTGGGNITMEAWVRITDQPANDTGRTIISIGGGGAAPYVEYRIYYQQVAGVISLGFNRGKLCVANSAVEVVQTLTIGQWYHLAYTYDGTNQRGYLDGVLIAGPTAASGDGVAACGATSTSIGSLFDNGAQHWNGDIDDVRVWTTVRTATEIADNRSVELVGTETGLTAYYKLNNALTDSTAGARTLTNDGVVTFTTSVPFVGAAATVYHRIALLGVG